MTPAQAELWVLGNLAIDDVVHVDGRVALAVSGGNGVYAAIGARIWSDRVGLAARVGPDYPAIHLEALREAGIELALAPVAEPSIRHWALYEAPDTRQFVKRLGSGTHLNQSLLSSEVPTRALAARVCHIAPMPLSVQSQLVHHLCGAGPLVSLDPHDEYVGGHADELLDLLRFVSIFLPSRHEARLIYGHDDPEAAARAFAAAGPRVVVIKLGAAGSLICDAATSSVHHLPAVPVTVVDPTGAGDAYCGAFALVYGRTANPLEAAQHAAVAASFVVQHFGATSVLPVPPAEAEARLRTFIGH
jgi:ribokinase